MQSRRRYNRSEADVAQLVEQSIRNRQVIGSSPIVGSSNFLRFRHLAAFWGGCAGRVSRIVGDFVGALSHPIALTNCIPYRA